MAQAYFLVMALGVPVAMLVLAMLGAAFYRDGYAKLLDWRPTRSPQREAELQHDDVDQMLAAQNRYRRLRGAPERDLDEVLSGVLGAGSTATHDAGSVTGGRAARTGPRDRP
jgi:hypothetical protein